MIPDFTALRAIGWPFSAAPTAGEWADIMAAHPDARPARVVEQHRSGYVVAEHPEQGFSVESLPEWQRPRLTPEKRPAVGDWLLIRGEPEHKPKAVALLPRRSTIKRAAAGEHYGQQLIAANIDTAFIVCGLDLDFNPRRIERYLLMVQGGAQPVVVLTKADVSGGANGDRANEARATLAELDAQDVPVCTVNALDHDSVATLHAWLGPGMTAVLVGSSGAGKSTLTNTLVGSERMKTGAVRENDARGRHTTTHRALISLASGGCLIDTPGMRELKPTGEEDLAESGFTDIEALARQCRFRNCQHDQEPGCALRNAIAAGTLDARRVGNYLKLDSEIAGAAERLAVRQAQTTGEKVRRSNTAKRTPKKTPKRGAPKRR
ncbi:ribosome small subunit-dependent GTPase A [Salinisphaera aquimarina]|uniref:Small ribosomal subunit biogenesis GTPase RsgA n=1 Tax=Salinisphaera aquimarina TaxID=2094031 RepID=A0ABV7ERU5_9GAMM